MSALSEQLTSAAERAATRHASRVIEPPQGWTALGLRRLWEYRDLLYFLVWRDIKIRYKQTALGVAWVALQPILATVIFTLIFGNLAGLPSENLPYALFALAGLAPWNYFAGALSRSGASLVSNANLISKVYFPRLIVPLAGVLGGLVDLGIVLLLLLGLMLLYGVVPGAGALLLPLFVLLALAAALGMGLWLAALNVRYRDVGYLLPFLVQFWMFATPVIYPASLVPDGWRTLLWLNPLTCVVEGFRWALFGTGELPLGLFGVSVAIVLLLLVSGAFFFRRVEATFADVI